MKDKGIVGKGMPSLLYMLHGGYHLVGKADRPTSQTLGQRATSRRSLVSIRALQYSKGNHGKMENQPMEQNKLQALQPAPIPFLFKIYREFN